mmetsp:Transcript_53884/g.139244  ORF Transcript_53884/g.139244 Transcript_53884/m.139244 type:complete len:84 (+) Transcript_53884:821-1072(+)
MLSPTIGERRPKGAQLKPASGAGAVRSLVAPPLGPALLLPQLPRLKRGPLWLPGGVLMLLPNPRPQEASSPAKRLAIVFVATS